MTKVYGRRYDKHGNVIEWWHPIHHIEVICALLWAYKDLTEQQYIDLRNRYVKTLGIDVPLWGENSFSNENCVDKEN